MGFHGATEGARRRRAPYYFNTLGTRLDELVGFPIRFMGGWVRFHRALAPRATLAADTRTPTTVMRAHAPALPEEEEAHDFFCIFSLYPPEIHLELYISLDWSSTKYIGRSLDPPWSYIMVNLVLHICFFLTWSSVKRGLI
jgi:hypothetical protein